MNRIKNKPIDEKLRMVGNILVVSGYFIVLNYSVIIGCLIRILATFLMMPYIIKNKIWDFAIVMAFFSVIDIHAIVGAIW